MSKKIFIGIDNGVSGSIACVGDKYFFQETPTKEVVKYTKKYSKLNRLNHGLFKIIMKDLTKDYEVEDIIIGLERPLVNPKMFTSTMSAIRCWEATLICLEDLGLPYVFLDSKEWQKVTLPKGIKGSKQLKEASLQVGNRLFPQFKDKKHKDRDAILIAEYLRLTYGE